MKEWLAVGRKVVCVNADPRFSPIRALNSDMDGLTEGNIYTIRSVDPHLQHLCVRLEEIIRPIEPLDGCEVGYFVGRFRPLLDRKTRISCFTQMLKTRKMEDAA